MMRLTKGQTQGVILTLTEKELLTTPNYLFVFTNRSSNTTVSFIKLYATDLSLYKDRFNEFSITTNKGMGAKPMKNYKPNPVFAKHYRQLN